MPWSPSSSSTASAPGSSAWWASLVIADLTRGTGRFNLMQGALATATGIGAASSNLMTGFVVKAGGYDAGFLVLAAIAAAALLFYGLAMPETATDPRGEI